jgi:4'-phosphopantetheinyl transferase
MYRKEEDRLHCLAGRLLMAEILGTGGELDESRLEYAAYGKPRLKEGPEFNLAHSGDFVLLALDDMPVGADIEQWRDEDHTRLARASFHADELAAFSAGDWPGRFYDLWTLKESYLKMRGLGLGINPASFRLRLNADTAVVLGEENLFLRLFRGIPNHSLAICSARADWPDRPTRVPL